MSAAAHCAVIRNPFSTAVANAKIPDGSVALTTSCRYSVSTTVSDVAGSIDLLLTGGFYSGLTVLTKPTAASANKQNNFTFGTNSRTWVHARTDNENVITQGQGVPNQYRVVSQGLRISLINNSQDNDGWFEAIRCTPSNSYSDWGIAELAGNEPTTIGPVLDRYEGNGGAGSSLFNTTQTNWAMNPSYIAWKARDLSKHNFILHRQENNNFIEIPTVCTMTTQDPATGVTFPRPFAATNDLSPWWVDKQMDSILIRIRANAATGGTNGNIVLHLHMVQHVEECYDERSDVFRFMTKCPANLSLLNATMIAMKRDQKPSIIRSPTMAVASPSYSSYKKKRTTKRKVGRRKR